MKLNMIDIPQKEADRLMGIIRPFILKYHEEERIRTSVYPWNTKKNEFGINELSISLYSQGLMDAIELMKMGKIEIVNGDIKINH